MGESHPELERTVPAARLLGYLNFAQGNPDAGWQKQLSEAYGFFARRGAAEPWKALHEWLQARLAALKATDNAFRNARQAEAVLALFDRTLAAYRRHHRDLLFHLSDADLFGPFFLARVFEAILAQGPPWEDEARVVTGALHRLNDFVGYRPLPVLETQPRIRPHERLRPVPLYVRGAGVGGGRFQDLVRHALQIIAEADPGILEDSHFDPQLLDELAMDPRAYDHGHPANRRPNYVFGEWDPHLLDSQGRFRRFVVRQVILEALLQRVAEAPNGLRDEYLFESAAVLAGTVLMAASVSGRTATTYDSGTTLAGLIPGIARFRDAFYQHLIARVPAGTRSASARRRRPRTSPSAAPGST